MKRVTPYSRVIMPDFIVNEKDYMGYLTQLSEYRDNLMKGQNPMLPTPVYPIYTTKGNSYLEKGIAELKQDVETLNGLPAFAQRGLVLSFESKEFCWGHTPLRLRHLVCGRISIVRAYVIYRKEKEGQIEKIACAKRECYEAMTGIKLAEGSATPSQAGANPVNATPSNDVDALIQQHSEGYLKLAPGGFKGANKAIVVELIHQVPDYDARFAVLSSHSNCIRRDAYSKAYKRLNAGRQLDSRTPVFSSSNEAFAYAQAKWA